jgi:hypothetical protein
MSDITKLTVRLDGPEGTILSVKGRVAWTLSNLLQAGERGVTPIERPAPRWSDYVFKLRKAGFTVETIDEAHGGNYSGHHARYVLRTAVEIIAEERK